MGTRERSSGKQEIIEDGCGVERHRRWKLIVLTELREKQRRSSAYGVRLCTCLCVCR